VFLLIANSLTVFSQEKYTKHIVSKGETISRIAQKYNLKSSEIYILNPDARNGIKYKTVLLLPSKIKDKSVSTSKITNHFPEKSHEVLAKETLYGISKQYNATIDDLYKINPNLEKEGLKKVTEQEVLAALKVNANDLKPYEDKSVASSLLRNQVKAGSVAKKETNDKNGSTTLTLSNGAKVTYKKTDFKNDEILFIQNNIPILHAKSYMKILIDI
jgi:LysM repeat protein